MSEFSLENEGRQKPRLTGDIYQVFSKDRLDDPKVWCSLAAGPGHLVLELRDEARPCGTENNQVLVLPMAAQVCSPWSKRRPMVALQLLKCAH